MLFIIIIIVFQVIYMYFSWCVVPLKETKDM